MSPVSHGRLKNAEGSGSPAAQMIIQMKMPEVCKHRHVRCICCSTKSHGVCMMDNITPIAYNVLKACKGLYGSPAPGLTCQSCALQDEHAPQVTDKSTKNTQEEVDKIISHA